MKIVGDYDNRCVVRMIVKSKILAGIIVIPFAILVLVIFLPASLETEGTDSGVLKAAIIDQLDTEIPNIHFQDKASEYLQTAGYEVDIFTTNETTVDFYKKLPSMNYKFIVIRSHAVGQDETGKTDVALFTGERYTTDMYIQEQLFGQVKRATPVLERSFQASVEDSSKWNVVNKTYRSITIPAELITETKDEYFAISPKLVKNGMIGQFPSSIIILGGCGTLADSSMAQSLIDRGASMILGWDDNIGSGYNDAVMLKILEETFVQNKNIKDVVNSLKDDYLNRHGLEVSFEYYTDSNN